MRSTVLTLVLYLTAFAAQGALLGRLPLDPSATYNNDGDYQAWYDTRLNVTWLDDTNYANSSGFSTDFGGKMNWVDAQDWIVSLNASSYLGIATWRLPSASPVNEMADLYFGTLGGYCPPNTGCVLPDYGPFDNFPAGDYWTSTLQFGGTWAEDFCFHCGYAGNGNVIVSRKSVWLVSDGDVGSVVPIPATVWLLGTGIVGLTGRRLRRTFWTRSESTSGA